MRVLPTAVGVWLLLATTAAAAAASKVDQAKLDKARTKAKAEMAEALKQATSQQLKDIKQMFEETKRGEGPKRAKEQTPRDGSSIKWHSMSEVRRLQGEGRKMVIARVDPLDVAGVERRLEVVAAELRARGAEEAIWIKRSVPGDDDVIWLQWEGVRPSTTIALVTAVPGDAVKVYEGSDTFTDLLTWLLGHLPPRRPREIQTEAQLEQFMSAAPVSVIAYVPQELGADGSFLNFVTKIAMRHPYLPVGLVYPAEELPYERHSLSPVSIYYRDENHVFSLDEDRLREMDDFTRDNALKKASHQFISRFPDDAAHIFAQGIDKIVFVFEPRRQFRGQTPSYLRELALEMRQRVVIAYVDTTDERMDDVKHFFGVELSEAVRGFDARTERQYWPTRAQGVAFPHEVQTFVRDLAANKLSPYRKCEVIPPHVNEDGETIKLNADTFETTALSPSLDVVVVFYTTWCPHSKRFIERFLHAAEESKGIRKVVFAVLDVERNDVEPKNKIRLFPTVILFRKGTNEEVVYTGRRNLREFLRWLDEEVARVEEKKEEPATEVDETAKGYESPLRKMIKDDHEQRYTLAGLEHDPTVFEEGDKGKEKRKEEKERGEQLQAIMAERVRAKLKAERPTVMEALEKEGRIGGDEKRKKDTVTEGKKSTVASNEQIPTRPEPATKMGTVVDGPQKKKESTVASKVPLKKKEPVVTKPVKSEL